MEVVLLFALLAAPALIWVTLWNPPPRQPLGALAVDHRDRAIELDVSHIGADASPPSQS